jgi:hypothetical protein
VGEVYLSVASGPEEAHEFELLKVDRPVIDHARLTNEEEEAHGKEEQKKEEEHHNRNDDSCARASEREREDEVVNRCRELVELDRTYRE